MKESENARRPDVDRVDLIGGTEKRHLEVVGYDDRWPEIFAEHFHFLVGEVKVAMSGEPDEGRFFGEDLFAGQIERDGLRLGFQFVA